MSEAMRFSYRYVVLLLSGAVGALCGFLLPIRRSGVALESRLSVYPTDPPTSGTGWLDAGVVLYFDESGLPLDHATRVRLQVSWEGAEPGVRKRFYGTIPLLSAVRP